MFKFLKKIPLLFRRKSPLAALELKLVELKDTDLRNAAEHAYALAMLYKQKGDSAKAIQYGRESIELFDRSKLRTEWDSMRRNTKIEGITLPEKIHQQIVREHLQPLDLHRSPKKDT